jgi:hypothetical protein
MSKFFPLLGPIITALIFIIGLFLLNQNTRREIRKDLVIKIRSLQIDNIAKTTLFMENIRILYWKLATKSIDLKEPLEKETEIILYDIGKLRAEWFASTLFLPEILKNEVDSLNTAFTNLTDVILTGNKFEQKKEANEQAHELISIWRIKAEKFIKDERIKIEKKFKI